MSTQTTFQILRCLTLGSYTAALEDGEIVLRGPQPPAGELPASIEAGREELIYFLDEFCGGVWPPAPGSRLREAERILGCGLSATLDAVEAILWEAA